MPTRAVRFLIFSSSAHGGGGNVDCMKKLFFTVTPGGAIPEARNKLTMEKPTDIAVFGLGYVGCVTAACLASLGHRVLGVDRDEHKVREIENGRAPFYEPGLEDLVRENIQAGRLSVSTLPTPSWTRTSRWFASAHPRKRTAILGLHQLRRSVAEIAEQLPQRRSGWWSEFEVRFFPGPASSWCCPHSRIRER